MKLQQLITQYIALRKSVGGATKALRRYCDASLVRWERILTADQVNAFLGGKRSITRYWHRQYNALQVFYRYAMGHGYVESSPLPAVRPKPPQPFVPGPTRRTPGKIWRVWRGQCLLGKIYVRVICRFNLSVDSR